MADNFTITCTAKDLLIGPFPTQEAAARYAALMDVDPQCDCTGHPVRTLNLQKPLPYEARLDAARARLRLTTSIVGKSTGAERLHGELSRLTPTE